MPRVRSGPEAMSECEHVQALRTKHEEDVLVEVCVLCGMSWRDGVRSTRERTGRQSGSDREGGAADRARHPRVTRIDGQQQFALRGCGDETSQGDSQ